MEKIITILFFVSALNGLSQNDKNIIGLYKLNDELYQLIIDIKPDSTFEIFNMSYMNIKGKWGLKNDTLFVETFLKKTIIEKVDTNRKDRIIRVYSNHGIGYRTIVMINRKPKAKNTDNSGILEIDIDSLKSIKILEGNNPSFIISNNEVNDITVFVNPSNQKGAILFDMSFKEKWLIENNRIYAWIQKEGIINSKRFYFSKIPKKELKYYYEYFE